MPIIKSAIKKLRQDKARRQRNLTELKKFKNAVKKAVAKPGPKTIPAAYSAIDRAAKKNIIHKNKAARLKSAITRKKS